MTTIQITAQGATAWGKVDGTVTAGAAGILVKLVRSREWDGLRTVVKFRCGTAESQTDVGTGSTATVPWDCLTENGLLEIALDGWDAAGTLRIPTNWVCCSRVLPSAAEGDGTLLPPEEVTAELLQSVADAQAQLEDMQTRLDSAEARLEELEDGGQTGGQTGLTVYCWGDSLTQGEGSNLKLSDSVFSSFNLHPYTDELTAFRAVNLGCQGETVNTIMARQGADPMVLGGFTIPADCTAVTVGNKTDGIPTASGAVARPLAPNEAGINPCTIAGVKGILHRGSSQDDSDDNYYFTRLTAGDAVEVPESSQLTTFAMENYRGGAAVIWMGANGGYSSVTDFISKVNAMLDYGKYTSYLLVISREFSGDNLTAIETAFTDTDGTCHVLNLYKALPIHGLTLANMVHYYFDTSSYANGDEILLKAPMLCEYSESTGKFGALHFSAYGYKAIGKLVAAKLTELLSSESSNSDSEETEPIYETNVSDSYGTILWKLKTAYTGSGSEYIDTGWAPYDDDDKTWTIAIKFADSITNLSDYGSIFESRDDSAPTALHLRKQTVDEVTALNIGMGQGAGFSFTSDQFFSWVGGELSTDGYHYLVLAKKDSSGNYLIAFDSGVWDGYTADIETTTDKTLTLFARVFDDGSIGQYTRGEIADFRIYDSALTATQAATLIAEMQES